MKDKFDSTIRSNQPPEIQPISDDTHEEFEEDDVSIDDDTVSNDNNNSSGGGGGNGALDESEIMN